MGIKLSDMAHDIVGLVTSETEAIVHGKIQRRPLKKIIRIPHGFENCTLLRIYIRYLQSARFRKLAATTRGYEVGEIESFFTFVSDNYQPDDITTTIIHPDYTNHLRDGQLQGNTVAIIINVVAKPLRWAQAQPKESLWDVSLISVLARVPSFKKHQSTPSPALSQLFTDCPYTDSELIESLRLTVCWFLSVCQEQREWLQKNDELRGYLEYACQRLDCREPPFNYFSRRKNVTEWSRKAYGTLIKAVCDSENDVMIERLFYSRPLHYKALGNLTAQYNLDTMRVELRKWLDRDGKLKTQLSHPKRSQIHNINGLTLAHLLMPSDAETLAMFWMLASERIQGSGLESLQLDDFSFSTQGMQTDFDKSRSVSKRFPSNLYKRSTQVYQAYKHWHDLMTKAQPLLAKHERKGYVLCTFTDSVWGGQLNHSFSGNHLALQLLTVDGSFARSTCLFDVPKATPFLWLLDKMMANNLKVAAELAASDKARKNNSSVCRSDYVKTSTATLSGRSVAQSRVVMDTPPFDAREDAIVSAMMTAHSPETKKNVYDDRSTARERIESAAQFAAQVGERMVVDAGKVASMLNGTEILDLAEARERLGLRSPAEDINAVLDQLDPNITVGLFGEFNEASKTFIITDKLTAALIHSYINHIENELLTLSNDNEHRATAALIHQEYLRQLLERFPPAIRQAGVSMANVHAFPFPSLVQRIL